MTFVALLRSINVGRRKVPMDTLRAKLSELGLAEVRTYVQSGNVVFTAPKTNAEALERRIERMLLATFAFEVPTIVRTAEELAEVAARHPFRDASEDLAKLHVTFLADAPAKEAHSRLQRLDAGDDSVQLVGREVYLHVPGSYAETRLSNAALEKALGVTATTRNLRTVTKLVELAGSGMR